MNRSQNSLDLAHERELCKRLILDLKCGLPSLSKDFDRDEATLLRRLQSESLPFLMQALPKLGKALLKGFQDGFLTVPTGFAAKGKLPKLFNGLFSLVFSKEDGKLRSDYDTAAAAEIYQITSMFNKVDLPYSTSQKKRVLDDFVDVDASLPLTLEDDVILETAADVIKCVFEGFDPLDITPRHGPGAVATGEKVEEKWVFKRRYEKINWVYPYNQYYVPSKRCLLRSTARNLQKSTQYYAKVVLVNKDSRGPRLISMEPLEFQFIQQGLARKMMAHMETHAITKGRVNFTDQGINRNLAQAITEQGLPMSTLDLSAASDRVSLALVDRLFRHVPVLRNCLYATRTEGTILPNRRVVNFRKFAPMGSALCFPVEAICFFAISRALERYWHLEHNTYVYGDDLIVATELADKLDQYFNKVGLKLNRDKCFTNGPFRESCGMDALNGHCITPIRMRRRLPCSRKDTSGLLSAVSLQQQLYSSGWWNTACYLESFLRERFRIRSYSGSPESEDGLCIKKCTRGYRKLIWGLKSGCGKSYNQFYGLYEKRYVFVQKKRKTLLDGTDRLFANLIDQRVDSYPVPHAGQIKLRWVRVFASN